jgi:peptidoglycan-associated lipoprotein
MMQIRRGLFLVLAAAFAAACASGGGTTTTPDSRGDFGSEGRDPGMGNRGSSAGGAANIDGSFRTIYFSFDDYSLSSDSKNSLRHNAALLRQAPNARLEIQGNCDERGTDEYNLALGKRRAEAAKQYLNDLGVDVSQLTTISFGEENPAVRGSTESAWTKNRRDEFVLR